MLSSDRNIETLSQLIEEIVHYAQLNGRSWKLSLVSKLSRLASALILSILLFMLASAVFVFLSFTLASTLALWVGTAMGYAIIALFYLLLGVLIYLKRKTWVEAPVVNFIANVMLGDSDEDIVSDSPRQV